MAVTSVRSNGPRHGFAYEDLTVDNTAGGIKLTIATAFPTKNVGAPTSVSIDQGAEEGQFTVEVDQVRYTLDGSAPTATRGHLLGIGDVLTVVGRQNLQQLRFIRVTTNATVRCTYFRD